MVAVEDNLEKCADIKVDIEELERLMEPEDEEVCQRYILKYSTRGGSNIFKLFDTSEKKDHLVGSLEHQGERVAVQERWHNEWHDIEYHGAVAKAPPCPDRTLETPLPQRSSSSDREEGGSLGIDGRQAKAKRCLRKRGQKC